MTVHITRPVCTSHNTDDVPITSTALPLHSTNIPILHFLHSNVTSHPQGLLTSHAMTHKMEQPYSGKNPVPTIATKLTALVNPEKATEAKAEQLRDQGARAEQARAEETASRLAKGRAIHATDPTTGEELDIRHAEDDQAKDAKGDNVLHQQFPQPGESFTPTWSVCDGRKQ